jgi:hypothetical protein
VTSDFALSGIKPGRLHDFHCLLSNVVGATLRGTQITLGGDWADVTSFTPALLKKQSTTSQQYPSPLFNFATRGQSRYRHGINTRIKMVLAKAMPETLVLKTLSNLISVRRMSCPTTIFYASSQSRRADNAAVEVKMRDSPNEDMLVASLQSAAS